MFFCFIIVKTLDKNLIATLCATVVFMFSKLGIDYYGQVTHAKFHFTLELWLATMNLVA